jgi:PGF-pre-PGF domain-containing protein
MNRTVLLVTVLGLGGTLLVSTGAVPLLDEPTDDISENVELYPSDSPDGKYAYIDDEGELVVDISASNPNVEGPVGVNPDTVTAFENVFRIRYNGSRYAEVWLTHESDAITFSARGEPIRSESAAVTLGPNESVGVDVHVDTTGGRDEIRADEMGVHAAVADSENVQTDDQANDFESDGSTFAVGVPDTDESLVVNVTEPAGGQRAVTIENLTPGTVVDADLDGLFIVDGAITLDGIRFESATTGDANFTFSQQTAQSAPVEPIGNERGVDAFGYFTLNHTIPDSAVENVSFAFSARWSYLDANGIDPAEVRLLRYGTDGWTILKSDRLVGTAERARFTVDSPGLSTFAVGVRTSQFVTADARVSPRTIQVGETATVTADVANRGAIAGQTTVTLTRNGSAVRNRTVALAAGENTTVRFDVAPSTSKTHAFAVDGTAARTLTVESPPTTPTPTASPDPQPTPTATPPDNDVVTGQPSNETMAVSGEAAGFDIVALGGIVAIVVLVAVVGTLRRRGP